MAVFFGKLQNGMGLVIESIPGSNSVLFQTAYHVGSAHESPKQAGIAHLFEHVMFGGSTHVASYDDALHRVGGTSNAYTTKDATHYWCKLPAYQLEIACWLESDRMAYLRCDQEVVETQRNVVIEEYKQTTLDEPYGGVWPAITAISYGKDHPYGWPTIGRCERDIAAITREDIINFGKKWYRPQHATIVIAGDIVIDDARKLVEKWFGSITGGGPSYVVRLSAPKEEATLSHIEGIGTQDALYKVYGIGRRDDRDYILWKLLAQGLGGGRFSLLYKKLVAGLSLFTDIEAFTTDHINDGLFVIGGKLQEGVALEHANEEVDRVINNLLAGNYSGHGWLEAAKGQEVGDFAIGAAQLSQRVESYAWGVLLGTPHFFYEEIKGVEGASEKRVLRAAKRLFHRGEKRLYYHARS